MKKKLQNGAVLCEREEGEGDGMEGRGKACLRWRSIRVWNGLEDWKNRVFDVRR